MNRTNDILLIEDNPYDVETMSHHFKHNRIANDLIVARTGEEALEYLYRQGKFQRRREGNPSVIILDIRFPKVVGIEVLHQIRHEETLRHIPVVIMSSYPEVRNIVDDRGLNVHFIDKPISQERFQDILRTAEIGGTLRHDHPAQRNAGHRTPTPAAAA